MTDQKNPNPDTGSQQGRDQQKNQNERAGQRSDQDQQPGKGPGGQSGDRDRASSPQGEKDMEGNRQPKPGQPNQQNIDR